MSRTVSKVPRTMPRVKGERLYQSQTGAEPIAVGGWAWYDWLEHHRSFRFVAAVGTFTAWFSLDEHASGFRVFVHSLTAALQAVFPDAFQATASLFKAARFPSLDEVATLLLNELADVPEGLLLVLDGYHFIRTSQVHTLLELLIEHLPPRLHLVLATQANPPLPLAKWRVKRLLWSSGRDC
jgi:ATP/maltotriose-dependent transcriptional regulator MalT